MEKNESNARFNEKQGQMLVKLARNTILKKLTAKSSDAESDTLGPGLAGRKLPGTLRHVCHPQNPGAIAGVYR